MIDPTEFGKAMGGIVREAIAPLAKRLDELDARQAERGEPGPPGEPGRDAGPVDVDAIAAAVAEMVTAGLLGGDGLKALIDLQVADSIAAHFDANPIQHGQHGRDGEKGAHGERGEKGDAGADGVGLASAMIDREGNLIVTKTNGDAVPLGCVVGKDGQHGKDGAHGLGFDDLDVEYDGERTFTLKWQRGDVVKTKIFHVPTVIDRGYWSEGTKAQAGDAMTHNGTLWIATKDTDAKPCLESDAWRIGARKGRDGIQGPPGKAYEPPQPVKLA